MSFNTKMLLATVAVIATGSSSAFAQRVRTPAPATPPIVATPVVTAPVVEVFDPFVGTKVPVTPEVAAPVVLTTSVAPAIVAGLTSVTPVVSTLDRPPYEPVERSPYTPRPR